MSDNKMEIGKPDRDRVSAKEDYEVRYLAQKLDLPASEVKKAIETAGPMRQNVEKYLKKVKTTKIP